VREIDVTGVYLPELSHPALAMRASWIGANWMTNNTEVNCRRDLLDRIEIPQPLLATGALSLGAKSWMLVPGVRFQNTRQGA
jgi:hypothetical protein